MLRRAGRDGGLRRMGPIYVEKDWVDRFRISQFTSSTRISQMSQKAGSYQCHTRPSADGPARRVQAAMRDKTAPSAVCPARREQSAHSSHCALPTNHRPRRHQSGRACRGITYTRGRTRPWTNTCTHKRSAAVGWAARCRAGGRVAGSAALRHGLRE